MPRIFLGIFLVLIFVGNAFSQTSSQVIVDTAQNACYSNTGVMDCPSAGTAFFGQDANYQGIAPSYQNNGDGTVTDLNTGLMWSKAVNRQKVSLLEAEGNARVMRLGGYSDWRVPNIKELYSLIDFRGNTGFSGRDMDSVPANFIPYINTDYFDFATGQTDEGERYIDGQWLTSTKYVSTTMDGAQTLFGVNFVDGRIKGYGYSMPGQKRPEKKFYARYVRGKKYGESEFADNQDGTISDLMTGRMWMKADSQAAMTWQDALAYCEALDFSGYTDWRVPDAKELQYLVDYTRSPETTQSAAINPIFQSTLITNEAGEDDYAFYWTSTTHLDGPQPGNHAVYVSFGRALGKMHGTVMDVHGAGAQRSDPKTGSPVSRGPQGDMVRVKNYARCVRGGKYELSRSNESVDKSKYPYHFRINFLVDSPNNQPQTESAPVTNDGPRGIIERLDRDGDGRISSIEFDGPRRHFRDLDTNSDSFLTEKEARSLQGMQKQNFPAFSVPPQSR